MNPARLISIATQMALSSDDTPERQDDLRRAVSTAYYAMFHTLANSNANTLIGAPENDDDNAAWNRTHRALEHGVARSRFRHTGHMDTFPDAVREFADKFNDLQQERQNADYNPDHIFTLSGALQIIDHARQSIIRFTGISPEIRRNLATYILFGNRPE